MTSLLEQDHDVTDLAGLLRDCVLSLPIRAAGLLVKDPGAGAELLSAPSHEGAELELYQVLWPAVGDAAGEAGFQSVFAFPLQWRGSRSAVSALFSSMAGSRTR